MDKEARLNKDPHSSRDFNEAIIKSGRVESLTSSGSHTTYRIRPATSGQPQETLTIIQGCRDLKDTNPKVWHKLVKKMKSFGLLVLMLAGAGIALERIITGAYSTSIESDS